MHTTEQEERTREKTEQWREFHYDGLYRWYQYTRHHVWTPPEGNIKHQKHKESVKPGKLF